MNNIESWKIDLFSNTATHANGTTVTFDGGQVADIDHLPSTISVHELSGFVKSAEKAYRTAKANRPRKPALSSWKVDLINHQATHTNGTTVSFNEGQVTAIDKLPPDLSDHDVTGLVKSAEKAIKIAGDNRPRKPILSLKKPKEQAKNG